MSLGTEAITALERVKTIDATPKFTYATTEIRQRLPSPSLQRRHDSLRETPFILSPKDARNGLVHGLEKDPRPDTVLYLAYGSNLCAKTFQGRRGIRPIAQVNVLVPELVMSFDLPGMPYLEPCFANTRYRNSQSTADNLNETGTLASSPPLSKGYRKTRWKKGLVGVVYEVTTKDYATIIATEGPSYQDILIDCYELDPSQETVPEIPTSHPFKAHTLFSPWHSPHHPATRPRISRPDPNYAQASQRYLKLITNGADEHSLPQEYKTYLQSLHPFTCTTTRQRIGRSLVMVFWIPLIGFLFPLRSLFLDKTGKSPKWLLVLTEAIFRTVWVTYDLVLKHVFGDGERTIGDDGVRTEDRIL